MFLQGLKTIVLVQQSKKQVSKTRLSVRTNLSSNLRYMTR
jgi:hypothetical protein